MINKEIISQIKAAINPISLITQYVNLKQQGKRYVALCPFHKEKTPSFYVNEEGMFHCFGCGKGGDLFNFIMEMEKLNFIEAVKFLADKSGIKITKDLSTEAYKQKEILLAIHREACQLYHNNLLKEEGKNALFYLNNRGITKETIEKFKLGYAPASWDFLVNYFSGKFNLLEVAKSGLIIAKENFENYYDRFRNRIIIPIFDLQGNPIAFGGRTLTQEDAKYINSPESPIFQKGNILFALNQARSSISKKEYAILVEGYFDVITLHEKGFDNTIGSLGTSLTENQISLLKRYTSTIYLCYDADTAGKKATDRAIHLLLQNDFTIKIVILEEGEDPDSFCRKYEASKFQEKLNGAKDFISFTLSNHLSKYEKLNPQIKSSIVSSILPLVNSIKDKITQHEYLKMISQELKIKEEILLEKLNSLSKDNLLDKNIYQNEYYIPLAEKHLLLACLHYPDIFQEILRQEEETFFEGLILTPIFEKLINMVRNGENINPQQVMLVLNDNEKSLLSSILLENISLEKNTINSSRIAIKKLQIERKLSILQDKINKAIEENNLEAINKLLEEKNKLAASKQYIYNWSEFSKNIKKG